MSEESAVRVDVGFAVSGQPVPLDHGYILFGAIASVLGDLHGAEWLSIHPLRGTPLPGGQLALKKHARALRLRVVPNEIPRVLELAGKSLDVAGRALHLGSSSLHPIKPFSTLGARMVVIKGFTEEAPFAEAVRRQLDALDVKCELEIRRRRVAMIAGARVVGFATHLHGVDDAGSMRVQYAGIGGRQRMGCGVFVPVRRGGLA